MLEYSRNYSIGKNNALFSRGELHVYALTVCTIHMYTSANGYIYSYFSTEKYSVIGNESISVLLVITTVIFNIVCRFKYIV